VHLFSHDEAHGTPDAAFPNNWFSVPPPGDTLVLWPMKCPNRRRERRPDLVAFLESRPGWRRTIDLTAHEERQRFLEGTGSVVFDHVARVAFVAVSERSDQALAAEALAGLGYAVVAFRATDGAGAPIYHTNVLMAVGTRVAVWCAEAVEDPAERAAVAAALVGAPPSLAAEGAPRAPPAIEVDRGAADPGVEAGSGTGVASASEPCARTVVAITRAQMAEFCGNILEVATGQGGSDALGSVSLPALAMSSRAFAAFTEDQRAVLKAAVPGGLLHAAIPTIEAVGGGGVRCCIAELF